MKLVIKKISGKWSLNDKPYIDLNTDEKKFFNEFIAHMRLSYSSCKMTAAKSSKSPTCQN